MVVKYFSYGYIPQFWLREGGIYETTGAVACFVAGLLNLVSFRVLRNRKQYLDSLWALLLAVGCLFLAGEEISWGQHFFDYDLPKSIIAANFQGEFNLHNSKLIQSSNQMLASVFFKLLMIYFIVLPMLIIIFPTVENLMRGGVGFPIPSMSIALIALFAKAIGFWNVDDHFWESTECVYEICLLILAIEYFYAIKRKV